MRKVMTAAMPLPMKVVMANKACTVPQLPLKIPTPITPIPNAAIGRVTLHFLCRPCRRNVAPITSSPHKAMDAENMLDDGWTMMLFGGSVAPRSLIMLSAVLYPG